MQRKFTEASSLDLFLRPVVKNVCVPDSRFNAVESWEAILRLVSDMLVAPVKIKQQAAQ